MAAASSCREEAERDPARRHLWLQEASKWAALAGEQAGHALIVCEQGVAREDTRH
ncbi:conserved hypothetical protein [Bradyrhizobium sp. ORS 375]|uniref:hypothetical protein n=1 Tax=Bradyrhizobium sp. (strain ORS 375) TaxID=566679 RepID=UPI000240578A|nr:hypothetical protein [Bradyrhizobium sp. ORS 375]CCD90628.1 conserved hypothetical protein [Bradyrhizobium sp. ORS 375]